jgi:hypothetical protein
MTTDHKTFDQNFEGLIFLLHKINSASPRGLIDGIFFPTQYLGNKLVGSEEVLGSSSEDILPDESISYLDFEKVKAIKLFLDQVDTDLLLNTYDADELNDKGVYPCIWHNDESPDQAFNRRHIKEGLESLKELFDDAVETNSLILSFVG